MKTANEIIAEAVAARLPEPMKDGAIHFAADIHNALEAGGYTIIHKPTHDAHQRATGGKTLDEAIHSVE